MRLIRTIAVAAALASAPQLAAAATVLGFEGINLTYPSATPAQILNFYDGGLSGVGTSGVNYGVSFASNAVAVCLNNLTTTCSNASRGGLPGTQTSRRGALGIDSGTSTYLDFATPYTGAIAFSYQVAANSVASIQAFSGAGGTGVTLTGPLMLFNTNPAGCPAFSAALCTLGPGGLGFVSNAGSIVFTGTAHRFVFDDLTFGAGNDPLPPPGVLPEPGAWALLLLGFGAVGVGLRRRKTAAV